ncbi:MAG: hypothetical protein J3Q66DRAFT_404520 [Benniella sp.]|nr:MAG: hypothetical protein J3Q66DRAFT_404520 [Benniella sp.]
MLSDWDSSTEAFMPWLLRKCDNVEKLRVQDCSGDGQSLAQGMLAHMPNLCKISLGNHKTHSMPHIAGNILDNIPGNKIATLLSGSRNGWKAVEVLPTASFGRAAMNALSDHFATLEVLSIHAYDGDSSDGPIRALRLCANLHACMGIASNYDPDNYLTVDAMVFIDQDPTFSLKPWKCETSLKVLKVAITGPFQGHI